MDIRLRLLLATLVAMALCCVCACTDDDDEDTHANDDFAADDDTDFGPGPDDDAWGDDGASNDDTGGDDTPDPCITGDFAPYFGMLHSHSLFSDGYGRPREAYAYARDEGDLDVFALTDHLEILHIPVPPNKWEILQSLEEEFYEPGVYVPLAGFEYSGAIELGGKETDIEVPWQGHNNVFYSEELFPWITLDYRRFYEILTACGTCLAQFNHPGWEGQRNWDGFEYHPEVDPQMTLIELSTWDLDAWPFLFEALDQGWHVSPTWNQDNHGGEWGTEDDHRTGFWLAGLTRESVRAAIRESRTFSTLDRNASVRLTTKDGCWMGSALPGRAEAALDFDAFDPDDGDGFTAIEVWGEGQVLLDEIDCAGETICAGETVFSASESRYALVRAVQIDGDLLVSAPIWLEP